VHSAAAIEDQARPTRTRAIRAESGDWQPPARRRRANRPVERYTVRIDPPDLIAGRDRDLRSDRRGTPFLRICDMVTQYWAARSRIGVSSLSKAQ